MDRCDLRIFELANSSKLLALDTSGVVWITLDLLLSACDACYGQSFPWFSCLGNTPVCVDGLAVDVRLTMRSIIVEIAESLPGDLGLSNEAWKELGTRPDFGS